MKLIIDIPEEIYKASKIIDVQYEDVIQIPFEVIANGIPMPCDDTISRQAVLDYIYNDLGLGDEENGKDLERQMEMEVSE